MARKRYACMVPGGIVNLSARSPGRADRRTRWASSIIVEGAAKTVGFRLKREVAGGAALNSLKRGWLEQGDICTLVKDGLFKIMGARYCRRRRIGGFAALVFEKNGIIFWAFADSPVSIVSINGEGVA